MWGPISHPRPTRVQVPTPPTLLSAHRPSYKWHGQCANMRITHNAYGPPHASKIGKDSEVLTNFPREIVHYPRESIIPLRTLGLSRVAECGALKLCIQVGIPRGPARTISEHRSQPEISGKRAEQEGKNEDIGDAEAHQPARLLAVARHGAHQGDRTTPRNCPRSKRGAVARIA